MLHPACNVEWLSGECAEVQGLVTDIKLLMSTHLTQRELGNAIRFGRNFAPRFVTSHMLVQQSSDYGNSKSRE